MRKPATRLNNKSVHMRGSSLLVAMILLLSFSIMIVAASHYLLGEQRISANQNDRQFAFQLAEVALKDGEGKISKMEKDLTIEEHIDDDNALFGANGVFTAQCQNNNLAIGWKKGLCLSADRITASAEQAAWKRQVAGTNFLMLDPCGHSQTYNYETSAGDCSSGTVNPGSKVWSNPRYIIELIDKDANRNSLNGHLYRITAEAWGRNKNTSVLLQSYYFVPYS